MALLPNDMLTAAYLIGAVNARPSREAIRQQYQGLSLLPWQEVPERNVIVDVMYSENNLAGFSDPRGQAIPGDDMLFSSMVSSLIDIKASRTLESWSIQQLRDAGMTAVYKAGGGSNTIQGMQGRLKDHINKALAWCNDAIDSQIEYIAMQALQGSVVWPPLDNTGSTIASPMPHWNSNMALNVPFPLPANQVQNATTLTGYNGRTGAGKNWKDADATPFDDLDIINEYMLKTFGINMRGGKMVMSSVTLNYLTRNTSIVNWLAGKNFEQPGARQFADLASLQNAITTQFGWTIQTYDSQWTYRSNNPGTKPTIQRIDFLKEGKVLIFPAGGPVGQMMTTQIEATDGSWVFGKMGWSYRNPTPPFDITLGVNATAWPRFDYYDWFVLDAYA